MTIKRKTHPYYDFRKIDSYNAFIKFICGARGLGKTFGAKKRGIKKALNAGTVKLDGRYQAKEQFIYVRRTIEELKVAKMTFFADIAEHFPNYDFRVEGRYGEASKRITRKPGEDEAEYKKREKSRKWFTICYFSALSVTQQQKSTSFPMVTVIIFDEFIIERSSQSSYLKSEVEALINFYYTVDRGQDKTTIFMLANSVSIMNPYFSYWDIQPDRLPEISKHGMGDTYGDVVVHLPDSKDYQKSIYETRFGKFIAANMPEYADYAVGNTFKDAHDSLVADKTKNAKYKYTVETERGHFSVWYDMREGTHYILSTRPGNERILTLLAENMDKGKIKVTESEPVIKSLRAAFNRGSVVFDKPGTRNAFVPIFDRK